MAPFLFLIALLHGAALPEPTQSLAVNLPSPEFAGPGTLSGMGQATLAANSGQAQFDYPLDLAPGYFGARPPIAIRYNSGAGMGILGLGWQLDIPYIQRQTRTRLARYNAEDEFVTSDGLTLVALGRGTYRAAKEAAFTRYHFIDARGDGRGGYWVADYTDGSHAYFGADAAGVSDKDAVVSGAPGIARYNLVEWRDKLGNRTLFSYGTYAGDKVLQSVAWVQRATGWRYRVAFYYSARPDPWSDARVGWEVAQHTRLVRLEHLSAEQRRWRIDFDYDNSSQVSQLTRIRRRGSDGQTLSPHQSLSLSYTPGIDERGDNGALLALHDCAFPPEVAGLPVRMIDLNGDAIADLLAVIRGKLWIYDGVADNGALHFAHAHPSTINLGPTLSADAVQLADIDGNGLVDFVDRAHERVIYNRGDGDLYDSDDVIVGADTFDTQSLLHIGQWIDYDNDARADVMVAHDDATWFYRGDGHGHFVLDPMFRPPLQLGGKLMLADFNGDGQVDVAAFAGQQVLRYRLNLGNGNFGPQQEIFGLPSSGDPQQIVFMDVSGDGIADAAQLNASAGELRLFINSNRGDFVELTQLALDLPAARSWATQQGGAFINIGDSNGNGVTDFIGWLNNGSLALIELTEQRAHLLQSAQYDNGRLLHFQYSSAALQQQADTREWRWPLRNALPIVATMQVSDSAHIAPERRDYFFHDAYYAAEEHNLGGFAQVEVDSAADDATEALRETYRYDDGEESIGRRGLIIDVQTHSKNDLLQTIAHRYNSCDLAEVPANLRSKIQFICLTERETRRYERQSVPVILHESYRYNTYGQQIAHINDGDLAHTGDERVVYWRYIEPSSNGGRWLLNLVSEQQQCGAESTTACLVNRYYYDGEKEQGLPQGIATVGLLMRSTQVDAAHNREVPLQSFEFQEHGGIRMRRDGNGHARYYDFDDDGLMMVRESVPITGTGMADYTLQQRRRYDSVFDVLVEQMDWTVSDDSKGVSSLYQYDTLGRLVSISNTERGANNPLERVEYTQSGPYFAVKRRRALEAAAEPSRIDMTCYSSDGRPYLHFLQNNTAASKEVIAENHTVYTRGGQMARQAQAFAVSDARCDVPAAEAIAAQHSRYDGTGRLVESWHQTSSGAEISRQRRVYGPLWQATYDAANLARFSTRDGLGRITQILDQSPHAKPNSSPRVDYFYTPLGQLAGWRSGAAHYLHQEWDEFGRLRSTDSDVTGTTHYTYDTAGLLSSAEYEGDRRAVWSYDSADRLLRYRAQIADTIAERIFSYDAPDDPDAHAAGRLRSARVVSNDPLAGIEDLYVYDAHGRMQEQQRKIAGQEYHFATQYNALGEITARTYPDGRELHFTRDIRGQTLQINQFATLNYDLNGRLTKVEGQDSYTADFTWDEANHVAQQSIAHLDDSEAVFLRHSYDDVGNFIQTAGTVQNHAFSSAHDYDAYSQLSASRINSTQQHFIYDDSNTLAEWRNRMQLGPDGATLHVNNLALNYTPYNHLQNVFKNDTQIAAYAYDAMGERFLKHEGYSKSLVLATDYDETNGVSTISVNIGNRSVLRWRQKKIQRSAGQVWQKNHAGAADMLPLLLEGATANAIPSSDGANDTPSIEWLAHDLSGQKLIATSPSMHATYVAHELPFGAFDGDVQPTNLAIAVPQRDSIENLYYAHRRYYLRGSGRWLTPDGYFAALHEVPEDQPFEAVHLYTYAQNNPLRFVDPWGLWSTDVHHYLLSQIMRSENTAGLRAMQKGSDSVDSFTNQIDYGHANEHSMLEGTMTQSQSEAAQAAYMRAKAYTAKTWFDQSQDMSQNAEFRQEALRRAYFAVGEMLHPVQDSTSPAHSSCGTWDRWPSPRDFLTNLRSAIAEVFQHGSTPYLSTESRDNLTPQLERKTLTAMRGAINTYLNGYQNFFSL